MKSLPRRTLETKFLFKSPNIFAHHVITSSIHAGPNKVVYVLCRQSHFLCGFPVRKAHITPGSFHALQKISSINIFHSRFIMNLRKKKAKTAIFYIFPLLCKSQM